MKINGLCGVREWLVESVQLVLRQWPVWLLAYGVQFGFVVLLIVGFAVGVGIPVLILIPQVKVAGLMSLIPLLWLLPVVGLGFFVALQLGSAWSHAAMTLGFVAGAQVQGPVGAIFRQALQRVFRAFWMSLLLTLILCGAAFCFLVPLFVVLPALLPAWYIAVIENRSVNESLCLSWERTRGVRGMLLGRVLLLIGVVIGLSMLLMAMQIVPFAGLVLVPVQLVLQVVIPVYFLAAGYLLYRDVSVVPADGTEVAARSAPLAVLYFLAVWGIAGWMVVACIVYFLLRKVPQLQNLV